MIVKSYEILKKNFDLLNLFLVYGENIGLKKDVIKSIINSKGKKNKGYKKFELEEEQIIKNQNDFFNLIYSGSLFDEKKAIIINKATDKLFSLIDEISEKKVDDILIFFNSENLEKKSKIRNFFEKDNNLICIPCYQDSNYDLIRIVNNEVNFSKIKISNESINLLAERAMGDRNNLRNELNKLKSFSTNKDKISFEQIAELTNAVGNYQNDYIINTCLNGDKKNLNKTLNENHFNAEDFFILLKILARKIHRLLKIKALSRSEKNLEKIFIQIKPPIFWKEKNDVKKQVSLWNEKKLNLIIAKINEIEIHCKKNYELSDNIMIDFLSTTCDEISSYS